MSPGQLYMRLWRYRQYIGNSCPDLKSAVKKARASDRARRRGFERAMWERRLRLKDERRWRYIRTLILPAACFYCGTPDARSVDHVIPVSRGGAQWDLDNLVPACVSCNSKKGNRTPGEWRANFRPTKASQSESTPGQGCPASGNPEESPYETAGTLLSSAA